MRIPQRNVFLFELSTKKVLRKLKHSSLKIEKFKLRLLLL